MILSPKIINLDFALIEIHPHFLISTIQEGVVFSIKHLEILYALFEEQYPNQKFGYISNRKFDYSIDPICYLESNKFHNLSCIAVWCHNETSYNTTKIEKTFNYLPFEAFFSYEECKKWIQEVLEKEN